MRHAFREALRAHTPEWLRRPTLPRRRRVPRRAAAPRRRPRRLAAVPGVDSRALRRVRRRRDARPIQRAAARPRTSRAAARAICSTSSQAGRCAPDHLMVFVGPSRFDRIAPTTGSSTTPGPTGGPPGEVRKVRLADLPRHPSPRWRPRSRKPGVRRRLQAGHSLTLRRARSAALVAGGAPRSAARVAAVAQPARRGQRRSGAFSLASSQIYGTSERPSCPAHVPARDVSRFPRLPGERPVRVLREAARPAPARQRGAGRPAGADAARADRRLEGRRAATRSGRSCAASSARSTAAARSERRPQQVDAAPDRASTPSRRCRCSTRRSSSPRGARCCRRVRDAEVRRDPARPPRAGRLRRRGRQRAAAGLHRRHRVGRRPRDEDGARPDAASSRPTGSPASPRAGCDVQVARRPAAVVGRGDTDADGTFERAGSTDGDRRTSWSRRALRRPGRRHRPRRLRAPRGARAAGRLHLHRQADLPARPHRPLQGRPPLARRAARSAPFDRRDGRGRRSPTPNDKVLLRQSAAGRRVRRACTASFAVPPARVARLLHDPRHQRRRRRPTGIVRGAGVPQAGVRGHRHAGRALRRPGRTGASPTIARALLLRPAGRRRPRCKYVVHRQPYYSPLRWTRATATNEATAAGTAATRNARGHGAARTSRAWPRSRCRSRSTSDGRDYSAASRRASPTPASREVAGNTIVQRDLRAASCSARHRPLHRTAGAGGRR